MTDLPADDRARAEQTVSAAMDRYPPGLLHRLRNPIILAGNIGFRTRLQRAAAVP